MTKELANMKVTEFQFALPEKQAEQAFKKANLLVSVTGGSIISGQGTNKIVVHYSSATSGTISVTASNPCGISAVSKYNVVSTGCPVTIKGFSFKNLITATDGIVMDVKAWPNPSSSYFNLSVNSNGTGTINVRVFDVQKRLLDYTHLNNGDQWQFGYHYNSGMYLIEVVQGTERKVINVVKVF